jgi:hypothetical protein
MIGRGTPNIHSKIPRPMIATPLDEYVVEKAQKREAAWA